MFIDLQMSNSQGTIAGIKYSLEHYQNKQMHNIFKVIFAEIAAKIKCLDIVILKIEPLGILLQPYEVYCFFSSYFRIKHTTDLLPSFFYLLFQILYCQLANLALKKYNLRYYLYPVNLFSI